MSESAVVKMKTQHNGTGNDPIFGYDRIVIGATDLVVLNGAPLPVIDISVLIDTNNTRMLALGPYDAAYVAAFRARNFTFFKDTYGLDFEAGFHEPTTDQYFLPNAFMIQVTRAADAGARLTFDSKYSTRTGKWSAYEIGAIAVMTTAGTYTSGARAGLAYLPGDILSVAEYVFFDPEKDWQHDANYRETIRGYPIWPVRQYTNSFGVRDTPAAIQVKDEQDNEGVLIDSTMRLKLLNGNWTFMSRAMFSWGTPITI